MRVKNVLKGLIFTVVSALMNTTVFATEQPGIVSGTKNLAGDVSGWLTLLIPTVAGAYLAYLGLQKSASDDQAHTADLNKKMKNTIISAVIGMSASGIITFLLNYYK